MQSSVLERTGTQLNEQNRGGNGWEWLGTGQQWLGHHEAMVGTPGSDGWTLGSNGWDTGKQPEVTFVSRKRLTAAGDSSQWENQGQLSGRLHFSSFN